MIADIGTDNIVFYTLNHCPSRDKVGPLASLFHFNESANAQNLKRQKLIKIVKAGLDPGIVGNKPIVTDRSMLMVYGNFTPQVAKGTFFTEFLTKLSGDTKFRVGVPVLFDELD